MDNLLRSIDSKKINNEVSKSSNSNQQSNVTTRLERRSSRDLEAMVPLNNNITEDKATVAKSLLLLDCPPSVLKKRNLAKNLTGISGILQDTADFDSGSRVPDNSPSVPIVVASTSVGTRKRSSVKYAELPTPGSQRKNVGFLDTCGRKLVEIHEIVNQDDPPEVPKSAFNDLKLESSNTNQTLSPCSRIRSLKRLFTPPSLLPDFAKTVQNNKVSLESCDVNSGELIVSGTVRAANTGSSSKTVTVRWTTNNWLTFTDCNAQYLNSAADSLSERFSFKIRLPNYLDAGMKLEFAVRLATSGASYWDNNNGKNYIVECAIILAYPGFNKKTL